MQAAGCTGRARFFPASQAATGALRFTARRVALAALGMLGPLGCSSDETTTAAGTGVDAGTNVGAEDAGAPTGSSVAPNTAAGRQLAWLLGLLNERGGVASEEELRAHFSPGFLQQVPVPALQQTLVDIAGQGSQLELVQVAPTSTETALTALVAAPEGRVIVSLAVNATSGSIESLLLTPEVDPLTQNRPESWEAVDASVASLAPRSSYLVARVDDGVCTPLHGAASDTRLGIGSAFKLYVLAELARQIEAGTLGWETTLTIRDALKSLPSGRLQDAPEGTELSLLDVALPMIAISDNTATDHLIDRLARENVEGALAAFGHGAPALNTPFLTTREFFLFKLDVLDPDVATYLAGDVPARRAFLESLAGRAPDIQAAAQWTSPRRIEEIEWFAHANELCTLMAALDERAEQPGLEPIAEVLTANPGLSIDPVAFPYIAFKGGSEPGVLHLDWLVHAASGTRYFVSLGLNDATALISDETPALRTALGIFDLLAAEP